MDLSDSLYDDGEVPLEEAGSFDGHKLDGAEQSSIPGSMRNSVHLEVDTSLKGAPRGQGPQLSNRYSWVYCLGIRGCAQRGGVGDNV